MSNHTFMPMTMMDVRVVRMPVSCIFMSMDVTMGFSIVSMLMVLIVKVLVVVL